MYVQISEILLDNSVCINTTRVGEKLTNWTKIGNASVLSDEPKEIKSNLRERERKRGSDWGGQVGAVGLTHRLASYLATLTNWANLPMGCVVGLRLG